MTRYMLLAVIIVLFGFISCNKISPESRHIIEIDGLNCTMDYFDWHYINNPELLFNLNHQVKKIKDKDQSYKIDPYQEIIFLIFQHPINTNIDFNNYIVYSEGNLAKHPHITNLNDELNESKKVIKETGGKIINSEIKNINGNEALIIEITGKQRTRSKEIDITSLYMVIIDNKNRKDYNFYSFISSKEYSSVKPIIERIYYSINKK